MQFTDDPLKDFLAYDEYKESLVCHCSYCEKDLSGELALNILGDLYCMECAIEKYGEEY